MAQHTETEPRGRRSGSGDALAAAFELVATPALFAFFGWKIDGWLGTAPIFLLVLTIFTAGYAMWRLFDQYVTEMDAHDAARRARQQSSET